jgi:hypothetical protein
MRGLAGAIVVGLTLGVGQIFAASPAPQYSPEEAHAGCLHTDLRPCMISLGTALYFDMNSVAQQIAKRNELDVNGKTAHRRIVIDATAPGHRDRIAIILTLASPAPNDTVVGAEIWLTSDPDAAHTQSEYDATFLYDAVAALLGNRCPGLDRLGLYRFYENSVKPNETVKTEVVKRGIVNHTVVSIDTGKIPFCGILFSHHKRTEWNGQPDSPGAKSLKTGGHIELE